MNEASGLKSYSWDLMSVSRPSEPLADTSRGTGKANEYLVGSVPSVSFYGEKGLMEPTCQQMSRQPP